MGRLLRVAVGEPSGAGESARSGDIDNSQSTWMEMKVCGPGTVKFHWKSTAGDKSVLGFEIDGESNRTCSYSSWHEETFTVSGLGMHTLRWKCFKLAGAQEVDSRGWVDAVQWQPGSVSPSASLAAALDTSLDVYTGVDGTWYSTSSPSYYGNDSAQSGSISDEEVSQMEVRVYGSGTATFWWKVDSAEGDYLEFWLDGVRQHYIDGQTTWAQKSYTISGSGTHTLKWQYAKDGSESGYDYCWVDFVQWSGAGPDEPDPNDWAVLSYTYDASGRRIAKKYDGKTILRYVYDGDHCIAEYAGSGPVLRRKYIYGPSVDEPICMIEGAATSYYHFDALGSVIALTDANGDVEQEYEYSIWGQVGAHDVNHPNRIMFTAREFDRETGLYYYRARYYHPEIGRFLQTDPVGYGAGMNLYRYCTNNPVNRVDPTGLADWVGGFMYADDAATAAHKYIMAARDRDPNAMNTEWSYSVFQYYETQANGTKVLRYGYTIPLKGTGTDRIDPNTARATANRIPFEEEGCELVAFGHSHDSDVGFGSLTDPNGNIIPGDYKALYGWVSNHPGKEFKIYLSLPAGDLGVLTGIMVSAPMPWPGSAIGIFVAWEDWIGSAWTPPPK